jgi:cytochrome P450
MPDPPLAYRPFGRQSWRDPWPLYRRLRDEDPLHHSPDGFFVLSRFADVLDASLDPATFSSAQGLTFTNEKELLELAPTVVMMDPPDHTRYRRLVNRLFSPRRVADLEPALRHYVRTLVAELAVAGSADFAAGIAREVPAWLVATYLGVPAEDRRRFEGWTEALVQANAGGAPAAGLADLYAYFVDLVARRRAAPGTDLISDLLSAEATGDGIGFDGVLGYAFVLVAGGNDTTTGLLAGAAELLTARPDQRRRLLDDRRLLPAAVEELLRLVSPVQGLCRVVARPVERHGRRLAAGDRVLLCYGSANRDHREFGDDAEELDVGRRVGRQLAFSSGPHFCLGAAAARLTARVVLDELLTACPDFWVEADRGTFADGPFTRRYDHLPIHAG